MAGRIGLEASEKSVNIAAGERGLITITVTNSGQVVDAFDLTVQNLEQSWYTLLPARISLFPKAKSVATLQIHPPMKSLALAGSYPFEVVATSRDAVEETSTLSLRLVLAASGDVAVEMEPQRIVGRQGTYRLAVNNASNIDRLVVLRPADAEEALRFSFGSPQFFPLASAKPKAGPEDQTAQNFTQGRDAGSIDLTQTAAPPEWTAPGPETGQGLLTLTIPAATRLEIPLTAQRREREWFGMPIPHRLEVSVTPPGVEWEEKDARKIGAELVYSPILAWMSGIPFGLRRLLMILIPLLILGLLLFLLFRPNDGGQAAGTTASQTQTAETLAAQLTAQALSVSQTQTALAGGPGGGDALAAAQTAAAQTALAGGLSAADQTATALAGDPGTNGELRIVSYDIVREGTGFRVSWEIAPTENVTVTLSGEPVEPVGSLLIAGDDDQSLNLEATNGRDTVSRAKGILLVRSPAVRLFTADQTSVAPGTTVTLQWETQRAERVTLDGAAVASPNGTIQVTPSSTTEYLLTAENSVGSVISRVTVIVSSP